MPSEPIPEDEIHDRTISEVVRKPTRTAGDLSEAAAGPVGIWAADLASDLEAVVYSLADLFERVKRIEEHLGIGQPEPKAFDGPRKNATQLRPVSSGLPEGSEPDTGEDLKRRLETIDRRARAQRPRAGDLDRPDDKSEPQE